MARIPKSMDTPFLHDAIVELWFKPLVKHDYERERFEQLVRNKLMPGLDRITKALNSISENKHLSESQQKIFLTTTLLTGSHLCLEESIRAITASTNEEGEIIFCGVNHDKSNLTYVRVAYDTEENDAFLTLSRYKDDQSVLNKYDVWDKVLPQIAENPLTDYTFNHSSWLNAKS